MRRAHFLRPNHGVEYPNLAVWVDTESVQSHPTPELSRHTLDFGWATYQRRARHHQWTEPESIRFTTPKRFWNWLWSKCRRKSRLYLYAHNWSFDGPMLQAFSTLPKAGWTLGKAVLECPPILMTWRKGSSSIEMIDTLNFWPVSLVQVGAMVDLEKLEYPGERAPRKVADAYCRRDVEIIRRAKHHWWDTIRKADLGGAARTRAGQAMRAYRHRFMASEIVIDADPRALELARLSYLGGRVEAYRLGRVGGPIYSLDVNSQYPHVMAVERYPSVLKRYFRDVSTPELASWLERQCLVARVILDTPEPAYGVLRDGKLVFPTGRFEAVLTTPDLKCALQRGHLRQTYDVAMYESANLFKAFVDELYRLRLKAARAGDHTTAETYKYLMNSLYGKFGQRGRIWETTRPAAPDSLASGVDVDLDEQISYRWREIGGAHQELVEEPESRDSHPAIAAHVTAYARRYLWDLMCQAGRKCVLYCDTDSLMCTATGYRRLKPRIHPTSLGALKLEATDPWIEIWGAKDYRTPSRTKLKGVSAKATWISPDTLTQEHWYSLLGLMELGDLTAPITRTVTKTLKRTYTKGRVLSSGRVTPLTLNEA